MINYQDKSLIGSSLFFQSNGFVGWAIREEAKR